MPTSAEAPGERVLRDGTAVRLRPVRYADPVAHGLVERVQQEYVQRYGGPDGAVVDPAEFDPPAGLFLAAFADAAPVGSGGWRVHEPDVVEVKRVYVVPGFRRRGLAEVIMRELEESAARAGHRRVVLNTGTRQPEALALYAALGYRPVPGYGMYACVPGAIFLGRDVIGRDDEEGRTWAS